MKTLKHIAQLSLLFFLITPLSIQAAPIAPDLTSPRGMLTTQPPVFKWDALFDASWYRIWVKDETGVIIADWKKSTDVCNVIVDGLCEYAPGISTVGTAVWQVRGYDNGELGAWSDRVMFFDSLARPGQSELLEPVGSATGLTPTFSWSLVPAATWYKIELVDFNGQSIVSQWLRANSSNVDCDTDSGICSKTPMVNIPEDFDWRIRTYNSAGLGPWTQFESVFLVPGSPLSANPNPLSVDVCSFENYEVMVSNVSGDTVAGIEVLDPIGDFILIESDEISEIECEIAINSLLPDDSCVITRVFGGDSPIPAFATMSVIGDGIVPLDIEIEVTSDNNCF